MKTEFQLGSVVCLKSELSQKFTVIQILVDGVKVIGILKDGSIGEALLPFETVIIC